MPFVTTLTFQSGDRAVLDRVVTDIKENAARKGAQLKGPHSKPPRDFSVPQFGRLPAGDHSDESTEDLRRFDAWRYTVHTRTMEIIGYDEFARAVADRAYPPGVHVGVEIHRVKASGSR